MYLGYELINRTSNRGLSRPEPLNATWPVVRAVRRGAWAGVAVVNERLGSLLFPSEDVLGQRIRVARAGRTLFDSGWITIIGIAPTINHTNPLLGRGPDPVVYIPYRSQPVADALLVARGSDTGSVVQHISALDPNLAVFDVQSLDTFLAFFSLAAARLWDRPTGACHDRAGARNR
jgi:hypothetical protein